MRRLSIFLILLISLWCACSTALPFFFIRFLERKYELTIKGRKIPSPFTAQMKIENAAFVWKDRVELLPSHLDLKLDIQTLLKLHQWRIDLQGDGAKLKFLGDWRRKTGVEQVQADRLRLILDFDSEGIRKIHHAELIAPEYKFQVLMREKKIK